MGCWNQTCAITGNAIYHEDEVVGMWLLNGYPLPFHVRGSYNDYGAIENEHGAMLKDIIEFIRKHLHEMEEGENQFHDIPVKKKGLNFKKIMNADHEGRLFLRAPESYFRVTHALEDINKLEHIQIHASVFDELVAHTFMPEFGDQILDVQFFMDNVKSYMESSTKMAEIACEATDSEEDFSKEYIKAMGKVSTANRFLFNSSESVELAPNMALMPMAKTLFIDIWLREGKTYEDIEAKVDNMCQTYVLCLFMHRAGRTIAKPPHVGQQQNEDYVKKLAIITAHTAQKKESEMQAML